MLISAQLWSILDQPALLSYFPQEVTRVSVGLSRLTTVLRYQNRHTSGIHAFQHRRTFYRSSILPFVFSTRFFQALRYARNRCHHVSSATLLWKVPSLLWTAKDTLSKKWRVSRWSFRWNINSPMLPAPKALDCTGSMMAVIGCFRVSEIIFTVVLL